MRLTDPARLLLWLAPSTPAVLHAQVNPQQCGPLTNAYGPYDYRTNKAELNVVERFHFTTEVEQLIRGKTGPISGDLDHALHAFPNHHRPLWALMGYGERLKTFPAPNTTYNIECNFFRADCFRHDDTTVRTLCAVLLGHRGRLSDELRQLDIASTAAGENSLTHYNLDVSALDRTFNAARQHAQSGLERGLPKSRLWERLAAAGQLADATAEENGGLARQAPSVATSR
jgi:hypothetical protein